MPNTDEHAIPQAFLNRASGYLLGDYLPKIERCLEKLSDEQIWWRANEESNSIGNLILHLCGNARQWIVCGVGSAPDARNRDAEFEQRDLIPRDELVTLLRAPSQTFARLFSPSIPQRSSSIAKSRATTSTSSRPSST